MPFYKKKYYYAGYEFGSIKTMADFENLPTITRDDIESYSQEFGISSMLSTFFPNNNMRGLETTGSTGKPVQMYMSS